MIDSTGREHMFLNFFVQGRPPGETRSESKYEAVTSWIRDASSSISELTVDGATEWMQDRKKYLSEQFKRVFRYLTGAPAPPSITTSLCIYRHWIQGEGGEHRVAVRGHVFILTAFAREPRAAGRWQGIH